MLLLFVTVSVVAGLMVRFAGDVAIRAVAWCLVGLDLRPEQQWITALTLILAARHDWICAPEFSEEIRHHVSG
jgi:hypothetical protein